MDSPEAAAREDGLGPEALDIDLGPFREMPGGQQRLAAAVASTAPAA